MNIDNMKASWLEAVASGEAEGFSRHFVPDILAALDREREKNAALTAECKKQWRLRMTGSACAVCGGQGRVSRAAIKLPETYEDCPSCAMRGPWAWLSDRLTVEDFQRLAKQHGDVVIRVREEGREAERARAKGLREEVELLMLADWFKENAPAFVIPKLEGRLARLSPSPEKCGRDSDGYCGLHDSHDCPPAVEKPCRPDNPCGSRDCPSDAPAVAPVESLTDDEGGL